MLLPALTTLRPRQPPGRGAWSRQLRTPRVPGARSPPCSPPSRGEGAGGADGAPQAMTQSCRLRPAQALAHGYI